MENYNKKYANIIVDISHEALDRSFQYKIPDSLIHKVYEGCQVVIPFGKGDNSRTGYIVSFSSFPLWPEDKLKEIIDVKEASIGLEDRTMELAYWMKKRYGSTLISAMQTVIPVKKKIKEQIYKTIYKKASDEDIRYQISKCTSYKTGSRKKLLLKLLEAQYLPYDMVKEQLSISDSVIKTLEKNGIIRIESERTYRKPVPSTLIKREDIILSDEQQKAVEALDSELKSDRPRVCLLHGITGSGKTEVYMEVISRAINMGRKAIVLIPEIALTFQTLMRFYQRFGDRVAVMHSKLSDGEKFDQYEQAREGSIDVVIGPRSALFVPFSNIGVIVIDEEHETSYKSEKMPKYNAKEVAQFICKRDNALLVLGSATPSLDSYYRAKSGEYRLLELKNRNSGQGLPIVHTVDMRSELKAGNKSFFSRKLKELITERIANGQQIMLFINRRGYAGFVSCRECGYVLKCKHCDVALSHHKIGNHQSMVCHYCGYETEYVSVCPECGSKYFAGFRAGTARIEEELRKEYPSVKILRMDKDTTKNKDDYDRILSAFAGREADILIGTQMIVKGHDFPYVTLVGIIAADMSLNASDYSAGERTFELITQCAGRAGRGKSQGEVVIQTYNPDNYSIKHASNQDYESFYEEELIYRSLADYPPVCHMLSLQILSGSEEEGMAMANELKALIDKSVNDDYGINGPAKGSISKVNDVYRYVIYVKHNDLDALIKLKDIIETYNINERYKKTSLQYDFDPSGTF